MMRFGRPVLRLHRVARSLSLLILSAGVLPLHSSAEPARALDSEQAKSAGIRKISGDHLVLYTDVASSPEVDHLPAVFDKAVPQWAGYFGIELAKTGKWQPRAFLIADSRRFAALGLLPPGREEFENAITIGERMWLREQPSDYYRRHLLLHEGTHAFMIAFLGGCGPGWYMEGMAELLGTHRYVPRLNKLTLGIMPRSREEVPMLGRIKLIEDARANHRELGFDDILRLDNSKQLGKEAYAWCWAAAKFLDSHPRYRDRFRKLRAVVNRQDFNEIFRKEFASDWEGLNSEWQAYIASLNYGYDFERMAIDFERGKPFVGPPHTTMIFSNRGWQSSGDWLEAGKSYEVTASGHYQIVFEQKEEGGEVEIWGCEPGGVTIDYYDGRPLGILLGAIDCRDKNQLAADARPTFASPAIIGLHSVLKPTVSGTLYLRINDSPARLDDNRGTLKVTIQPVP
jgi:hypothetical protein